MRKSRKPFKAIAALFAAGLMAFTAAGCGGKQNGVPSNPTVKITSGNATINAGETYTLSYSAADCDSVTVTVSGGEFDEAAMKFTAQQAGSYVITVTAVNGEVKAQDSVTVTVINSQQIPEDKEKVDRNTLIRKLKSNIYSDNIECTEPSGLSDASVVGVNKAEYEKTLWSLPENSEFAHVFTAAEKNISPENTAAQNTNRLNALFAELKTLHGKKKIEFSKGEYHFNNTLNLRELKDVYIAGNNSDFIFDEWLTAMNITRCENLHINDLHYDYKYSPSVAGTVAATDEAAKTITMQLYDEFDLSDYYGYGNGKINYGNFMEYVYDAENECYYPNANGMLRYNSTGDRVNMISNGTYDAAKRQVTFTFNTQVAGYKAPAVGTVCSAAFTMYEYTAFHVTDCENYYMESCNIYASCGMAMTLESCRNSYFNNVNYCLREGTQRLMTATADCLHAIDCYGDLDVTNSLFEYSHDDAINVCSFYRNVTAVNPSGRKITLSASSSVTSYPYNVGDVIELYDKTNLELKARYTITETDGGGMVTTVTVDKRPQSDLQGCLAGNTTRVPNLKIKNCIIRNKRNRAILAQVRNSEISGCTIYNVVHGGISLHSTMDIFSEAILPRDFVIKNNKFINNNQGYGLGGEVAVFCSGTGGTAAGAITGVSVTNNFFCDSSREGVSFTGTGDCSVKNNLFYDVCRSQHSASVSLSYASNTVVSDNFTALSKPINGFVFISEGVQTSGTASANNGIVA